MNSAFFTPSLLLLAILAGCGERSRPHVSTSINTPADGTARAATGIPPAQLPRQSISPPAVSHVTPRQAKILANARQQIGTAYVADYVSLSYPGGDVPVGTGACTDVVVRALRAVGVDLQRLVHEDMQRNFRLYPKRWGLRRPDTNIDHRRVPNLVVFLRRFGRTLPIGTTGDARTTWQPGDIVVWVLDNGRDHCGVVMETVGASGLPTVIHNLGSCAEEDCLTTWRIVGHYRYPKDL